VAVTRLAIGCWFGFSLPAMITITVVATVCAQVWDCDEICPRGR
jgi:hypothetical protein